MDHDWKPKRLRVADVVERPEYQFRVAGLVETRVRALVAALDAGVVLPPIDVARLGRALCAVDGFHRLEAARRSGHDGIEARVATMSREDATVYAMAANVRHGLNLSGKDRAHIFNT